MSRYRANYTVYITVEFDLGEDEQLTQELLERMYEDGEWEIHDHEQSVIYDSVANVLIEPESLPELDDNTTTIVIQPKKEGE